jgi:hypothetical protein
MPLKAQCIGNVQRLWLYELFKTDRQFFDILCTADRPVSERRYPREIPPVPAVAKSLRVYSTEFIELMGYFLNPQRLAASS